MEKTIESLVTICANKVRVQRKVYIESNEMKCRTECLGYNDLCNRYYPMEIGSNHYLVRKIKTE